MNIFKINRLLAALMCVVLIGVGLLGAQLGMTTSVAYDVFHVIFGVVALAAAVALGGKFAAWFNLGFGAIDLYQAVAYNAGLFPSQLFNLNAVDTLQHWLIGGILVGVALLQFARARKMPKT